VQILLFIESHIRRLKVCYIIAKMSGDEESTSGHISSSGPERPRETTTYYYVVLLKDAGFQLWMWGLKNDSRNDRSTSHHSRSRTVG
jgi:hypothetical protein